MTVFMVPRCLEVIFCMTNYHFIKMYIQTLPFHNEVSACKGAETKSV